MGTIKFQVEIKKDKTYPLYFKDNLSNLPVLIALMKERLQKDSTLMNF